MTGFKTSDQVSAGGVVYRQGGQGIEVALISVGEKLRWQLPKGLVGRHEEPLAAAQREVREEAGVEAEPAGLIETIEYWYFASTKGGKRIRFHKHVHFYLFRYLSGDVADHDHEVNEARWVPLAEALEMLSFANEKKVVAKAQEMIAGG